jgi:hypothetical protein
MALCPMQARYNSISPADVAKLADALDLGYREGQVTH